MIYKFIQYENWPQFPNAHNLFMLSATAEQDPGFTTGKSTGKQRPMVQQVLQNDKNHQEEQQSSQ
jgi:hypothetical protein